MKKDYREQEELVPIRTWPMGGYHVMVNGITEHIDCSAAPRKDVLRFCRIGCSDIAYTQQRTNPSKAALSGKVVESFWNVLGGKLYVIGRCPVNKR